MFTFGAAQPINTFSGATAYAGPTGTGPVAHSQASLSGQVVGAFATAGPGWSTVGGFAGFSGTSSMSGYFLGAYGGYSAPTYHNHVHRDYYTHVQHDRQTVTTNTTGRMWDVWFDHQDGQKTQRRSPIVLDLNGNGKPDITGKNVLGDGKISGEPVMFDIDPSRDSWSTKSVRRRPGSGAPAVKDGTIKYEDGTTVKLDRRGRPSEVTRADGTVLRGSRARREASRAQKGKEHGGAKYYDKSGELVGELKRDETTGKMMYHWGNHETREKTEWLAKGGGDGLLVWDVDNDGNITSSKELFGEFDVDGKKRFNDGYEKLAHHFDKNKDGKVNGSELNGLKIWKDADGDAKVDAGELQSLSQHDITNFDVANVNRSDMSSTFNRTTTGYRDVTRVSTGYTEHVHSHPVSSPPYFGWGAGTFSGGVYSYTGAPPYGSWWS